MHSFGKILQQFLQLSRGRPNFFALCSLSKIRTYVRKWRHTDARERGGGRGAGGLYSAPLTLLPGPVRREENPGAVNGGNTQEQQTCLRKCYHAT